MLDMTSCSRSHVCIRCGHPIRWHREGTCWTPPDCLPCACRNPDCEYCESDQRAKAGTEAECIVRVLAAITDPTVEDLEYAPAATCGLCGVRSYGPGATPNHRDDCPWRLAVEWVQPHGR